MPDPRMTEILCALNDTSNKLDATSKERIEAHVRLLVNTIYVTNCAECALGQLEETVTRLRKYMAAALQDEPPPSALN